MRFSLKSRVSIDRRRCRGTILILVACLMLGFMALLALIADLGVVRTTQLEMNSAADAAALEGLRWRDTQPPDVPPMDETDRLASDAARRDEVNKFLQYLWVPNSEDSNFGLGPEFTYTPSAVPAAAAIYAGGLRVPETQPTTQGSPEIINYQPGVIHASEPPIKDYELQFNLTPDDLNDPAGDMEAGHFPPDYSEATSHVEGDDFNRLDFTPETDATASADAPLFLVRFRRSNDPVQSSDDPSKGIGSTGPTLPLMFGQGSLIPAYVPPGSPPDASATYPYRENGFTVRSASIANAVPSVYVGMPIPGYGTDVDVTLLPVAVRYDFWKPTNPPNLPPAGDNGTTRPVSGISSDPTNGCLTLSSTKVGFICTAGATSIGTPLTPKPTTLDASYTGYAPIVDKFSDGQNGATVWRVIGFAYLQVTNANGNITITNLAPAAGRVAPRNASGNPQIVWSTLGLLSDWSNIMAENQALSGVVLSPVLVRSRGD